MSWQPGVVDYKALPEVGAVEMWDSTAQAGYSYDATRKVLNTYDVPAAVKAKCDYVNRKGLGGLIIWESMARNVYCC
jgi:chitinase